MTNASSEWRRWRLAVILMSELGTRANTGGCGPDRLGQAHSRVSHFDAQRPARGYPPTAAVIVSAFLLTTGISSRSSPGKLIRETRTALAGVAISVPPGM